MAPQTQVRKIIVKAEGEGIGQLRDIAKSLGNINKSTQETSRSMRDLSSKFNSVGFALRGLFASFAAREFIQAADQFQLLRDRLTVFTGSAETAKEVFLGLAQVANETKASITDIGTIYNRVALSTNELGLSQKALLDVVKVLQNSFRLSGASAAEATAATIQLSQGLSSGQLRGQELRSVLEQNAVLSEALARGFGIARGQLIKFAEAGKITSQEVLRILAENFDDINKRAEGLQTTIGQALTLAFDKFRLKLDEINQKFGISSGIIKGIEALSSNFDNLSKVVITLVASAAIIKLAGQLLELNKVIKELGLLQLGARFGALGLTIASVGVIVAKFWDDFFPPSAEQAVQATDDRLKELTLKSEKLKEEISLIAAGKFSGSASLREKILKNVEVEIKGLRASLNDTGESYDSLSRRAKKFGEVGLKATKFKTKVVDERNELAKLNDLYASGTIKIDTYNKMLENLEKKDLSQKFLEGKIALDEYNKGLENIEKKFRNDGPFLTGVRQYTQSAGTLANNIANGVEKVFGRLEDVLVEFTKTGKLNFRDFTNAVIEDINRIIIRSLIVRPLADAILNFGTAGADGGGSGGGGGFGGGGLAQTVSAAPSAKGNAFLGGKVQAFASGGIVSSPTLFNYNGNKLGVAGEAGTEAILPLKRTASGDLGVESSGGGTNVQVNIINNTDSEIESNERTSENGERVLDVIISRKIQENFNSGRLDRTLGQLYGLQRKGT